MITKIEIYDENSGYDYYIGMIMISCGKFKGDWLDVTIKCETKEQCIIYLNDFIESTK